MHNIGTTRVSCNIVIRHTAFPVEPGPESVFVNLAPFDYPYVKPAAIMNKIAAPALHHTLTRLQVIVSNVL